MKGKVHSKDLEALAILQEECAETIQAASKIMRFGIDNIWNGKTPRQELEEEIGDALALIEVLVNRGLISEARLQEAKERKFEKLKIWSSLFNEDEDNTDV